MSIEKNKARDFLPLVNHLDNYELLVEYANMRIAQCHKEIESALDMISVARIQGRIQELNLLKKLQEQVRADSK